MRKAGRLTKELPCFFMLILFVNNTKRVENMIYCCEEHVELALDTIVDEHETFPILSKLTGDNLSTTCEYCQNTAVYVVANE
jgi:CxxH/CxxC protein (TIGR04129 family)